MVVLECTQTLTHTRNMNLEKRKKNTQIDVKTNKNKREKTKNPKIFKQNVQNKKSFRLQSKCDIYVCIFIINCNKTETLIAFAEFN